MEDMNTLMNENLWHRCDNCNGIGGFDYLETYLDGYPKPKYFNAGTWEKCGVCQGFGWLDWISNVRGRNNREDYFKDQKTIIINDRVNKLIDRLNKSNNVKAKNWLVWVYLRQYVNDWKWRGE